MLRTQIFGKKAVFPKNKLFWPILFPIIGCDKSQGTVYKGPKGILTITVEVIGSFVQDLKGC